MLVPCVPRTLRTAVKLCIEDHALGASAAAAATVAELLEGLDLGGKRVAVAVNRDVVIRSRYAEHRLAEGDRIEILEAVGGG